VILHAVDASDPEPADERIARVRAGLDGLMPAGAREIVVATHATQQPDWADAAVELDDGAGVAELRARVLDALTG
jgi:hypothetical protein